MSDNSQPVLYVFMRNDMDSLNPGKAMAQAAHASNQFIYENYIERDYDFTDMIEEWMGESSYGYGTTIVLSADIIAILKIFDAYGDSNGPLSVCNIIKDDTYPIHDGKITHLIPVVTCLYLFGRRTDIEQYTKSFSLYP